LDLCHVLGQLEEVDGGDAPLFGPHLRPAEVLSGKHAVYLVTAEVGAVLRDVHLSRRRVKGEVVGVQKAIGKDPGVSGTAVDERVIGGRRTVCLVDAEDLAPDRV